MNWFSPYSYLKFRFDRLERLIVATEQESREALNAAITGTLAYVDEVVRERDEYKAALEVADAEQAEAVANALADEAAEDAVYNESKVEELRRLQQNPEPTE